MQTKIILVEDDYFLRDGLCELLQKEKYAVSCAETCASARTLLQTENADLVILDVMLPDGNGLELCTELRSRGSDVPVLFLTACDEEYQIVCGLDAGADAYVTKPFQMLEFLSRVLEFLSRVRALLRRRRSMVLQQSNLQIDMATIAVKKDGDSIALPPTEFQILTALMANRGNTLFRSVLL